MDLCDTSPPCALRPASHAIPPQEMRPRDVRDVRLFLVDVCDPCTNVVWADLGRRAFIPEIAGSIPAGVTSTFKGSDNLAVTEGHYVYNCGLST